MKKQHGGMRAKPVLVPVKMVYVGDVSVNGVDTPPTFAVRLS